MASRQLTCLISFIFFLLVRTAAQDSSHRVIMPVYTYGAFFFDFPQSFGVTAGTELPISSRHVVIVKKGRQKEKYRDIITTSDVGFYRYPFNNTGLFLLQSAGYRYHKIKPYYFEWLVTIGVLRTFYDGTVYAVSDNGVVTTMGNFGRLYAITCFTTVFCHDFERNIKPKPMSVSIHTSLWIQYPYNSFILPHLSLQLSFSYHFSHFNLSARQKNIKRIPN